MHHLVRNQYSGRIHTPGNNVNHNAPPIQNDWNRNNGGADENQNYNYGKQYDNGENDEDDHQFAQQYLQSSSATAYPVQGNNNAQGQDFYQHQKSASKAPVRRKTPGILFSTFGTRQLAAERDRETYIRITIRELIIYIVYLAVLCIICFGTTSSSKYYFTRVLTDLFVDSPFDADHYENFRESSTIDDFWKFAERNMIEGIYWEFLYNDGVVTPRPPGSPPLVTQNGILFENKLIGAPRLRQIRVRPDSCEIAPNFRRLIRQCYAPYETSLEDKTSPWGPLNQEPTAWKYYTEKDLKGCSYWGRLATYSGGGSYVDLKVDQVPSGGGNGPQLSAAEKTRELVKFLKENHWVTRATRVIFLDFSVYNANINLFSIVKLIWEVPATGGVLTSSSINSANLIRYLNPFELYVIFPCEIIFCIFTLYYLVQEVLEMIHEGCRRYWADVWSWVDLTILAISFVCIGLHVYQYIAVKKTMNRLNVNSPEYISMEMLGWLNYLYLSFLAVLIFTAWIKMFKYISFNKTMTQLSATLSRCAADIGGFAIMFFIVFAAFAQLGYLMFGAQVEDFSTFHDSVFTLLRLILGDFNFRQIEAANRFLGPLFFIAYVFFVFFVLLNMFLAIINETFGEVKAEIQSQRNEFEIADYFKRGFNNIRGWFGKKDPKLDAKYAVKLSSADGQITYDELRKNLQDAQFSDVEIEMFLARYELDRNRALDEDEIQHVLAELEGRSFNHAGVKTVRSTRGFEGPSDQVNYQVYQEEMDALEKRISSIESSLSLVTHKIEQIVQKLDKIRLR